MGQPQRIGRYLVREELGRGGFATVYRAYDPRFDRDVAVKVLPHHFLHDPNFARRFYDEARTIANLEHAAIVPVYDFGGTEDDDAPQPYLVMRLLTGGSLRDLLDRHGCLPLPETVRILRRLAPALDKAHRRGIIHRDIKPENVLFDEDGQPFLTDFGIARISEATHTMTIIGTPPYMSPEQWEGQVLDGRSDVYGLGVMLYEMLGGERPYKGTTPPDLMRQHLLAAVPDILAANSTLPPGCRPVVTRALAKNRAERFGTAAALAEALADAMAGKAPQPTAAVEAPPAAFLATEVIPPAFVQPTPATQPPPATARDAAPRAPRRLTPRRAGVAGLLLFGMVVVTLVSALLLRALGADGPPTPAAALDAGAAIARATADAARSVPATPTLRGAVPATPPATALPGAQRRRTSDGMVMLYAPAGRFLMGALPDDPDADADEFPLHPVTLDAFWLDETEITVEQWNLCVAAGRCADRRDGDADRPVTGITWEAAAGYCAWIGGALPTEAQWEYAARGPDELLYGWDGGAPDCRHAAYDDCGHLSPAPVGTHPDGAGWLGAQDLAGNVLEWVADWYASGYYAAAPEENPAGPPAGRSRVVRSAAWDAPARYLRASNRGLALPDQPDPAIGFRCVVPAGG